MFSLHFNKNPIERDLYCTYIIRQSRTSGSWTSQVSRTSVRFKCSPPRPTATSLIIFPCHSAVTPCRCSVIPPASVQSLLGYMQNGKEVCSLQILNVALYNNWYYSEYDVSDERGHSKSKAHNRVMGSRRALFLEPCWALRRNSCPNR